jgi:cell division protease FtsH
LGNVRNIAFWVVLFLLILALFNLFNNSAGTVASNARSYSEFVAAVEGGSVSEVTLDGEQIRYRGTDNNN